MILESLDAMKNCIMPLTAAEERRTPSIVAPRIFLVLLTKDHVVAMSELLGVCNSFEARGLTCKHLKAMFAWVKMQSH